MDAHGCPACPHPAIGPAIQGSHDVNVNRRPALRVDDPGIHAACCGANTWTATVGCPTVFINGKAAHRMGDQNRHCGGLGQLVEGSPNVIVGNVGGGSGGASSRNAVADNGASGGRADVAAAAAPAPPPPTAAPPARMPNAVSARVGPAEDPTPMLVNARWSARSVRFGGKVKLRATCGQLAGQTARFVIVDSDTERVVGTVTAPCGASSVEAEWQAPDEPPPHEVRFDVEAAGKSARSDNLLLVVRVEATLILDFEGAEEPAADRSVVLIASPSGEQLRGRTDADGRVVFDEAPSGRWTLLLDD
jgi:uncharacterized Zn-binding protein involved in type VI secretion